MINKLKLKNKDLQQKNFDDAVVCFILNKLKIEDIPSFKLNLTFLLFFRENINNLNACDYTTEMNCDDIFKYINGFFVFLENNKFFNFKDDLSKIEILELIYKFCCFLKENNLTDKSLIFIKQFNK